MAKQLKDWLNEFVQNGADPKDVTDWPTNAGGGTDISPLVIFKAGEKIAVDFSKGNYYISTVSTSGNAPYNSYIWSDAEYSSPVEIVLKWNLDCSQITAAIVTPSTYQSLSNQIVIYNGQPIPIGQPIPSETETIDYAWPTVEFTLTEDFGEKILICDISSDYSITNGQPQPPQPKPDKPELPDGFVLFEEGQTFKVNFSRGSYNIAYPGQGTNATYIINECIPSGGFPYGYPEILIQANEEKTQLIASLANPSDYQALSNQVVIYEGDLTNEPSSTIDIDYAWPTVEFTVLEMDTATIVTIYDDYSITN